jgi:hypothetical protein
MTTSAIISPCGLFRYRLERPIADTGIVMAFFGVNPSTADEQVEDQTTMKWRGFAQIAGARRYIAGNPFAFRAVDVNALAAAADPVGPDNGQHIREIIASADVLVPCWGSRSKLPRLLHPRLDALSDLIRHSGKPVRIFGLTKSGDPKHPLMLSYSTTLIQWS